MSDAVESGREEFVRVPILTRVEGEGGLLVRLRDGRLEDVELQIYEPPRLFEALLRGRPLEDAPDITARICGICPVAYQMTAVHALEQALGIVITPEIRRMRRLLYCGEWIESHALHIHLLHAPDFFDAASGIELAQRFRTEVERGLQLKKFGNRLLEVLGGRAIHPINVAVGGFYRWPPRAELRALIPHFEWGLQAAIDVARWTASFPFPDFEQPYEFVALAPADEYPFNEGPIASSRGDSFSADQFDRHFVEQQVAHSTALHSVRVPQGTPYFLGPLARLHLNRDRLLPISRQLAGELGFDRPCRNLYRSIVARSIELVQAYEEALLILLDEYPSGPSRMDYEPRAGAGCAATEAPRGLLFHRYEIDEQGQIVSARIIPPTSQNQRQIEADLRAWLNARLPSESTPRPPAGSACLSRDELAVGLERVVRNYDPCISCSTHVLRVAWDEQP